MSLRIGSLCTGYGGLDLAVMDVLGGSMAWHCQYEPPDKHGREDKHQYAARILAHHWPDVPNHGDLTTVDWNAVEPVDILTAGFPCQPFSAAGRQAGAKDERWLWDDVAQAIRILRPSLVVLENVQGLLTAPGRQPDCICGWDLRWGRHLGDLLNDHEWANSVLADDGRGHGQASRAERALGGLRRTADLGHTQEAGQRGDAALGDLRGERLVPALAHAALSHGQAGPGGTRAGDVGSRLAGGGERPWDFVDARDLSGVGCGQGEGRGAELAGDGGARRGDCPACGRSMDDSAQRPVRRAVGDVLRSLSRLGFSSEWSVVRASDVGAAHSRKRIFILAWPADAPRPRLEGAGVRGWAASGDRAASDADRVGHEWDRAARQPEERHAAGTDRPAAHAPRVGAGEPADQAFPVAEGRHARAVPGRRGGGAASDASGDGRNPRRPEPAGIVGGPDAALGGSPASTDATRLGDQDEPRHDAETQLFAELGAGDRADLGRRTEGTGELGRGAGIVAWGAYEPAIRRWEHILGRPAPGPTDDRGRLAPAFVEWMMGLPAGHVTDVPAAPGMTDAGLRNARLKALGNGVVRQQAVYALRLLLSRLDSEVAA